MSPQINFVVSPHGDLSRKRFHVNKKQYARFSASWDLLVVLLPEVGKILASFAWSSLYSCAERNNGSM